MGIANMSAILLASFLVLTYAASALPAENIGGLQVPALHETLHQVNSDVCPSGWVDASFVDMGCLFFNSTEAHESWDDTAASCQLGTQNATLVEILTENQMAFVLMQRDVIAVHEEPRHWWTGASDVGINGKWFWTPSLSPVGDFLWHTGFPNSRTQDNCMILHLSW